MKVVEEIEKRDGQFWIGKYSIAITHEKIGNFEINEVITENKIISIWKACIKFIEYYNKNLKK